MASGHVFAPLKNICRKLMGLLDAYISTQGNSCCGWRMLSAILSGVRSAFES